VATLVARIHETKAAYIKCTSSRASQLYQGKDDPTLVQQIIDACSAEGDDFVNAEIAGAAPQIQDAKRTAMKSAMVEVAQMAIDEAKQDYKGK
jgi:hypothetical protein